MRFRPPRPTAQHSRHGASALLTLTALIATSVVTGASTHAAESPAATEPSAFVPIEPCRLADTREGDPAVRLAERDTVHIVAAGRCDVDDDAVAVAVTFTAVLPGAPGFLTVYPQGEARPGTSILNYGVGDVIANHQFVRLGAGGGLSVYSLASVDVVVDVTGYFMPVRSNGASAGRYVPVTAQRLIDTRNTSRPAAGSTVVIDPLLGDDATAVAVNITTADTRGAGHFTAYASGGSRPNSSVLNVDRPDQIRAASAVVPLGPDGFEVYTSADNHVIVDITGYFTGSDAPRSQDGLFVATSPIRLVDTRAAAGPSGGPRLWDHGTREFDVTGLVPDGASAVAANVAVTQTEDAGFVVAYPARTALPSTSTINHDRGQQTVANFAVVGLSDHGLALAALEATHVVVDIGGWFLGEPVAATTGAPRNDPPPDRRVTVISDSAMAGVRWNGALGGFQGFDAVAKLESCRRLVQWSCRGREGYAPRTARSEIESLPTAGPEEILVIAVGYNDWHTRFSSDFDLVIDAARRKGFHHIAWVDYRSNVGYRLPGSGGISNYGEMNRILGEKLASGDFPDVRRWAFDSYTAGTIGWFTYDGVHETRLGSWGVADWISRHVRAFDDRPCVQPWTVGGPIDDPCPDPDQVRPARGVPDIGGLYPAALG